MLIIGVSLATAAPDMAKTNELTWKNSYWTEETGELQGTPIWQNYRVLTVIMLVATVVLVFIYR
jgi:SSS family solute:Na+ symporter